MKKFWQVCCAAALTAMMAVPAVGAESVKLKLQIHPRLFASSRRAGYQTVWQTVGEEAARLRMRTKPDRPDESQFVIYFYDTVGRKLAEQGLALLHKFKIRHGRTAPQGDLTLELRRTGRLTEDERGAFRSAMAANADFDDEDEVLGLVNGVPGNTATFSSVSAEVERQPSVANQRIDIVAHLFPVLRNIGIAPDLTLRQFGEAIKGYNIDLGEVVVARDEDGDIKITLLYDAAGRTLRTAELWWEYEPHDGAEASHRALFDALQRRTDVFAAGCLKTPR